MNQDFWVQIPCYPQGVALSPSETIVKQFAEISLTIPSLRYRDVGKLVITNLRFVFLTFKSACALSFNFPSKIVDTESQEVNNEYGMIKIDTINNGFFSFQLSKRAINDLNDHILRLKIIKDTAKTSIKHLSTKQYTQGGSKTIGMENVINTQWDQASKIDSAIDSNTADLETLRRSAAELLDIARQLSKQTKTAESDDDPLSNLCFDLADDEQLSTSEMPKNRGKSRNRFEEQLAQDFSKIIAKFFKEKSNLSFLSAAEAFVVFNRIQLQATGRDLISPKDLNTALNIIRRRASQFSVSIEEMDIETEDGDTKTMLIIVDKGKSFDQLANALRALKSGEYVTAFALSKQFKISEEIVQWYLKKATRNGIVVIDESFAGDRYYRNEFRSFKPIAFE